MQLTSNTYLSVPNNLQFKSSVINILHSRFIERLDRKKDEAICIRTNSSLACFNDTTIANIVHEDGLENVVPTISTYLPTKNIDTLRRNEDVLSFNGRLSIEKLNSAAPKSCPNLRQYREAYSSMVQSSTCDREVWV